MAEVKHSEASTAAMEGKAGGPPRRILIVDDEEGMRHMLSMLLSRHGYAVLQASTGEEALVHLSGGAVDVMLTDVRMPEMTGLELLEVVKERRIPVTVIMMSAFVDLDIAVAALKLGAVDYVSKPFKNDEVVLKIRMAEERMRLDAERIRLQSENAQLRGEPEKPAPPTGIIGKNARMAKILATIAKVADYKSTVLLQGESGTGKELVARAVHDQSNRSMGPFVPINCGAIPEALLESELFGHVKGAFTDASRNKQGLVAEASKGTLFLDEIGDLPISLQVKLLRFLQEGEIRRVGDTKNIPVDVRIVAATAQDLSSMVEAGTFREDLYYRLNVVQLVIPPLRERRDDIPVLAQHFIEKYAVRLHCGPMTMSEEALRRCMDYDWPGNIRELENTIERSMVLTDNNYIDIDTLPEKMLAARAPVDASWFGDDLSVKRATQTIERELIRRALEKTGGNRTRAATLLDLSHRALLYKIKDYGLA